MKYRFVSLADIKNKVQQLLSRQNSRFDIRNDVVCTGEFKLAVWHLVKTTWAEVGFLSVLLASRSLVKVESG